MAVVVIGSGPAAAAATHALCDAGLHVTVLDAGDKIEPGRAERFEALARTEPADWPPELAHRIRNAFPADIKHVPLKPVYGSLFSYVLDDPDFRLENTDAEVLSSLAYGGLSNAWGAAMLPYRQADIERWPITLEDLEPHYEAVHRFVPMAAERDELRETIPLYTDTSKSLPRTRQAEEILERMRRHAAELSAAGFSFGASRLAVNAAPTYGPYCHHCGLCLYGCPYGAIYNATHTFEQLRSAGKIDYRGGIYVDRLAELDGLVKIDFHGRRTPGTRGQITASRVFVACGPIASTRLVLQSVGHKRPMNRLRDSQYFALPAMLWHSAPVSVATQGNTLAQVFVELEGSLISERAIHLQIYGYNDIMLAALARRVPLRAAAMERLLKPVIGRMVLIQGFLHSDDSPRLSVSYEGNRVRIVGEDIDRAEAPVRKLVRRLHRRSQLFGISPVPGLLHMGRPGKSNHFGGSLPMRRRPRALETDTLGRIPAWRRIHVVDASVFPSIPATTVTLSVMANAHRIATVATRSPPDA